MFRHLIWVAITSLIFFGLFVRPVHDTLPANEPRTKIPETCSKCHSGIYNEYLDSIHGEALVALDVGKAQLLNNPVDQVGQFDPEGTVALSQASLDFAYKHFLQNSYLPKRAIVV